MGGKTGPAGTLGDGAPFVWPPREPGSATPPGLSQTQTAQPLAPTAPSDGSWLRVIEREWLGCTRAPLSERLAQAGWSPDAPGTWCRRCGEPAGPYEVSNAGDEDSPSNRGVDDRCPTCRSRRLPWARAVRVGRYEGVLRRSLLEVKSSGWRRLGFDLGVLLSSELERALAEDDVDPERCVLVPVPTPWWRVARGGIDHTLAICRGLRRRTGLPIAPLLSAKTGPKQVSVASSARRSNVSGRFRVRGRAVARWSRARPGFVPLVVDDIRTTGATMREACRTLAAGGAVEPRRAWCVTVAVTPPPDRRGPPAGGSGGTGEAGDGD